MAEREKVIEGLREMSCRCTWQDIDRIRDKFQPIVNGAIDLLKEQESEWVEQVLCYDTDVIWMCGKCKAEYTLIDGTPLENEYFFCPHCGAKMTKEVRVEEEEDE